jgi:hypothetical protein
MRYSLACVLLVAACYHDPGVRAAPPSNAAPVRGRSGPDYRETINDPVGFLPLDSEVVLGLDGDQLRKSELWKQLEPGLLAKAGAELATFKSLCKVDPIASIHSIAIGMKNVSDDNPDGVLVVHGLDREPLMACLSGASGSPRKVAIEDGVITVRGSASDPNNVVFAWVDRRTVVVLVGTTANKALLADILASGSPLRGSPAFTEMFSLIDSSSALWALVNGNGKLFDKAGAMGLKPKAVFGSLSLADGLAMNVRMRLATAAEASQIVTAAQGQLGVAKSLFDRLDVTADNADVVLGVAMTDQQLQSMIGMIGGMYGSSIFTPTPPPPPPPHLSPNPP